MKCFDRKPLPETLGSDFSMYEALPDGRRSDFRVYKPLPDALAKLQTISEDNLESKNYLFINKKDKSSNMNYLLVK